MSLLTTPQADGFAMPAEWSPQQAVWIIWPYRKDNWRADARPAQQAFAAVAAAILQTTAVFIAVPEQDMAEARAIMPARATLVAIESDDAWIRDSGPTIVVNGAGERRAISWTFNAWGGLAGGLYAPWDRDEAIASQVASHHGLPCYQTGLVLEGGSIHVDGEGTLLTTAECLLNPNRNPQLDKNAIEQQLRDYLGVSKIIWLPYGVFNDETDGHVDNLCCFVRPGEVALHWTDDRQDPQYARSLAALEILQNATDARGRALKIWKIPAPGPFYSSEEESSQIQQGTAIDRPAGNRLAASYVNFLLTNRQIVYPLFATETDSLAASVLGEMFPGYLLTGVPAREILLGGGNIHCITQQIPL
ncbi:agmatine deiminase [Erwinia sp. BNK-24-b]|uniref:agmatine deiminase n=1 Tax=unclassified Erwinia TaxID=2622719 RepID=UPI0039BFC133